MNTNLSSAVVEFDSYWRKKYLHAIINDIDRMEQALYSFKIMNDGPIDISECEIIYNGHHMKNLFNIGNIIAVSPVIAGLLTGNAVSFNLLPWEHQEKIMEYIINKYSPE